MKNLKKRTFTTGLISPRHNLRLAHVNEKLSYTKMKVCSWIKDSKFFRNVIAASNHTSEKKS